MIIVVINCNFLCTLKFDAVTRHVYKINNQ